VGGVAETSGLQPLAKPIMPHQCQFCGRDIALEPHKRDCRIVTDIDGIPGYIDIPAFLRREREPKKPEQGVFD
jgi:hypothetical protein